MPWLFKTPETITPTLIPEKEASTSSNCAWCGQSGDENGSHGICETHKTAMIQRAQERKEERKRER